jgi:hypothetical protein
MLLMDLVKYYKAVFISALAFSLINCENKDEQKEKSVKTQETTISENKTEWSKTFDVKPGDLSSRGANKYFILQPGYQLRFQGNEDDKRVVLIITVLNETKIIDGFETRVVEERESKGGKLVEVSRNYFAIDKKVNNLYYFGEEVDIYKNGKVISHDGAWESGKEEAKFGLMLPGKIEAGNKYYQEIAPNVAMDRAEIISDAETLETPAGSFKNCIKTEETTPLEPGVKEYKIYAPGIGLVKDGELLLTKYNYQKN